LKAVIGSRRAYHLDMAEEPQVSVWIEQETIHLKVSEPFGDPVELTEAEAKRLASDLLEASRQINEKSSN